MGYFPLVIICCVSFLASIAVLWCLAGWPSEHNCLPLFSNDDSDDIKIAQENERIIRSARWPALFPPDTVTVQTIGVDTFNVEPLKPEANNYKGPLHFDPVPDPEPRPELKSSRGGSYWPNRLNFPREQSHNRLASYSAGLTSKNTDAYESAHAQQRQYGNNYLGRPMPKWYGLKQKVAPFHRQMYSSSMPVQSPANKMFFKNSGVYSRWRSDRNRPMKKPNRPMYRGSASGTRNQWNFANRHAYRNRFSQGAHQRKDMQFNKHRIYNKNLDRNMKWNQGKHNNFGNGLAYGTHASSKSNYFHKPYSKLSNYKRPPHRYTSNRKNSLATAYRRRSGHKMTELEKVKAKYAPYSNENKLALSNIRISMLDRAKCAKLKPTHTSVMALSPLKGCGHKSTAMQTFKEETPSSLEPSKENFDFISNLEYPHLTNTLGYYNNKSSVVNDVSIANSSLSDISEPNVFVYPQLKMRYQNTLGDETKASLPLSVVWNADDKRPLGVEETYLPFDSKVENELRPDGYAETLIDKGNPADMMTNNYGDWPDDRNPDRPSMGVPQEQLPTDYSGNMYPGVGPDADEMLEAQDAYGAQNAGAENADYSYMSDNAKDALDEVPPEYYNAMDDESPMGVHIEQHQLRIETIPADNADNSDEVVVDNYGAPNSPAAMQNPDRDYALGINEGVENMQGVKSLKDGKLANEKELTQPAQKPHQAGIKLIIAAEK